MTKIENEIVGKVHPEKTLFLRSHVGEAEGTNGEEYEMASGVNGAPMVRSKKTRKWYTLSWQEIINLAVGAGIDEDEEEGGE